MFTDAVHHLFPLEDSLVYIDHKSSKKRSVYSIQSHQQTTTTTTSTSTINHSPDVIKAVLYLQMARMFSIDDNNKVQP